MNKTINTNKSLIMRDLSLKKNIKTTKWAGNGIDIALGLLYLKNKHDNCDVLFANMTNHKRDIMWKIVISFKCAEGSNKFKISFPYNKEHYIRKIKEFKKKYDSLRNKKSIKNIKRVRFILIPFYLGDKSCDITRGHFNLGILDLEDMKLERFEPYGYKISSISDTTFDNMLEHEFNKNGLPIDIISPQEFMTEKYLQYTEEFVQLNKGIGQNKKSDPFGFCGVWAIWFAHIRLKFPRRDIEILVGKSKSLLEKTDMPLRDFIRNYSEFLRKERNKMLGKSVSQFNQVTMSLENKIQEINTE